mmetsp:Transcript_48260/g.114781  ORF Transcript_48260/g.114781 Transcript_48260/m.114781 type:complete len:122 (+) Transcript_48260:704-1069(+)
MEAARDAFRDCWGCGGLAAEVARELAALEAGREPVATPCSAGSRGTEVELAAAPRPLPDCDRGLELLPALTVGSRLGAAAAAVLLLDASFDASLLAPACRAACLGTGAVEGVRETPLALAG